MVIFLGLAGLWAGVTLENEMVNTREINLIAASADAGKSILGIGSKVVLSREQALALMLQPITWSPSSSIQGRQNQVIKTREEVFLVFPFLTADEQLKALYWLNRERHEDLWD